MNHFLEGKDFLSTIFSPLVAVISSPDADSLAKENNCPSFTHFITPFGSRIQGRVQLESVQGQPMTLDSFTIRFKNVNQISHYKHESISKTLDMIVKEKYRNYTGKELPPSKDRQALENFRNEANFGELTPWYTDYRDILCRHAGISEHETFNHPVAFVVAVSSSSVHPLEEADMLYKQAIQSSSVSRPFLNTNVPRLNILVHDVVLSAKIHPQEIIKSASKESGTWSLLKINSRNSLETDSVVPDIWSNFLFEDALLEFNMNSEQENASHSSPVKQKASLDSSTSPVASNATLASPFTSIQNNLSSSTLGLRLSQSDFAAIDVFIKDFIVSKVVLFMTNSIRDWERDVASNRRGISARLLKVGLKYFGNGGQASSSGPITDSKGNLIFPFDSQEFIMRKLGDYAFMLRDYRHALSTYETVKKDFTGSDKLIKYLAGTMEMMALCTLLTDVNKGSFDSLAESCYSLYKESKSAYFCDRSSVLIYEILKERHLYKEAAAFLVKMAGEDLDLKSSIYLEQSSLCFLRCYPCLYRKYIFHLVLSGHRYMKSGHKSHGIRNYLIALASFPDQSWGSIRDHLYFSLARQAFHSNDLKACLGYFIQLISTTRQGANQQNFYFREFLYAFNHFAPSLPTSPSTTTPSTTLSNNMTNINNNTPIQGQEQGDELPPLNIPFLNSKKVYTSLQPIPVSKSQKVKILKIQENQKLELLEKQLHSNGYPSRILGDFMNGIQPLQSFKGPISCVEREPVFISFEWINSLNIPLILNCIYLEISTENHKIDKSLLNTASSNIKGPDFDVQVISDIALDPHERKLIQLSILPKKVGVIKIHGISYLTSGVVPTHQSLVNDSGEHFILHVGPPMPVLNVVVKIPEVLYSGQVVSGNIQVTNTGSRDLYDLKWICNCPRMIYMGSDFYKSSTSTFIPSTSSIPPTSSKPTSHIINNSLEKDEIIQIQNHNSSNPFLSSGSCLDIPILIRGQEIGNTRLDFVFGYVGATNSNLLRTFQVSTRVQIIPSLKINLIKKPSTRDIHEFMIGLQMTSMENSMEICIQKVIGFSPSWDLQLVENSPKRVKPNGSLVLFTRAIPVTITPDQTNVNLEPPESQVTNAIERLIMLQDPIENIDKQIQLYSSELLPSSSSSTLFSNEYARHVRHHWRIQHLCSQYPGLKPSQVSKLFTLYYTHDVDLYVFWEIPDLQISGFHHIGDLNLGLQPPLQLEARLGSRLKEAASKGEKTLLGGGRALFASTVREQQELVSSLFHSPIKDASPIRVLMKFKEEIHHDFALIKSCILPLEVCIHNSSKIDVARIHFELSFASQSTLGQSTLGQGQSKQSMEYPLYIGKNSITTTLQPESKIIQTMYSVLTKPGVYNLNQWKLTIVLGFHEKDETCFIQSPINKRLVHVYNS